MDGKSQNRHIGAQCDKSFQTVRAVKQQDGCLGRQRSVIGDIQEEVRYKGGIRTLWVSFLILRTLPFPNAFIECTRE